MAEKQNVPKTYAHCQFCPGMTFASTYLQPLGCPTSNTGFQAHPVPKITLGPLPLCRLWVKRDKADRRSIKHSIEGAT